MINDYALFMISQKHPIASLKTTFVEGYAISYGIETKRVIVWFITIKATP